MVDVGTASRMPQRRRGRSVRARLTLLYGALFLVSGVAVVTVVYLLVAGEPLAQIGDVIARGFTARPPAVVQVGGKIFAKGPPNATFILGLASRAKDQELSALLFRSGLVLAGVAVISVILGWLMAGRVLRPLRDITTTARHISEENLHQRLALGGPQDEIRELGDTIDGLLARLEAAFDAQRYFVANASHELRTPLAMMRTSVDVATGKRPPPPPEVGALAGKVREGLDQADRIVESFLTLARAQRGVATDQAVVSLPDLAETALGTRAAALTERGMRVQRDFHPADVAGSETLLARMVDNVVDNAARHGERGGTIQLATAVRQGQACLVAENSGPLLDAEVVAHLAEPFRRAGTERVGSADGVGMGLAIVAAVATAHGGSLRLEAREAGGLRVVIELPLAAVPVVVGA